MTFCPWGDVRSVWLEPWRHQDAGRAEAEWTLGSQPCRGERTAAGGCNGRSYREERNKQWQVVRGKQEFRTDEASTMPVGTAITIAIQRCHTPMASHFIWKLRCHWLRGLSQRQISAVLQDPAVQSTTTILFALWVYFCFAFVSVANSSKLDFIKRSVVQKIKLSFKFQFKFWRGVDKILVYIMSSYDVVISSNH